MRPSERIDVLLAALRTYWLRNPDLRLGQIVGNLSPGDPYYVEDDELLDALMGLGVRRQ